MDESNYIDLAKARIERAKELMEDAKTLLEKSSYASANNRAYLKSLYLNQSRLEKMIVCPILIIMQKPRS